MKRKSYLPIEVKLVKSVRKCRTCKWFWGETPPYGDFPLYDWNTDYPKEVRNQKQTTEYVSKFALKGKGCGQGQVDPGIMHGCRKAPIMTIGINPNLTSYFPSSAGARWSFPKFKNDARYAYYYRHHNVYQESFELDYIKKSVVKGTAIIAKKDGWVVATQRGADYRWLLITIQYVDEDKPREIEVTWTDKLRFVMLVDRSFKLDKDKLGFKKGDIIGGKIKGFRKKDIDILENSTGYYQRYVYVLEEFKKAVGGKLKKAPLSISEDVAQHDMIACASPGWSSKYDIPTARITKNCVADNAWLLAQLLQSRPAVIVIVGGSSLDMFAQLFAPYLKEFDYSYTTKDADGNEVTTIKETFQLLKDTTERKQYLHIKVGDYELKSRIVLSPHFSYSDNFLQQVRMSPNAWAAFQEDFYPDYEVLKEAGRIKGNTFNNITPILIKGSKDTIQKKISASGWNVLMSYYYDPIKMLADVLTQEYRSKNLVYDPTINRLKRAEGGCKFCVNDLWKFPEGCPYKKDKEEGPAPGELEKLVDIISQGFKE